MGAHALPDQVRDGGAEEAPLCTPKVKVYGHAPLLRSDTFGKMYAIAVGYILDLLLGDPPWLLHPVRGIGWLVVKLESILRKFGSPKVCGAFLVIVVVATAWASAYAIIRVASLIDGRLEFVVSCVLIYFALATRDLDIESRRVYDALRDGDLTSARAYLSRIVGRDTEGLSREEVVRAAVETVAENTVDGVISPLFYAFLGGPPLAWAYKAVSTLDSMVGYKDEKYKDFGWFSARLDDAANWLPARISAILIIMSAFVLRMRWRDAFKIVLRDGRKSASPNSGIPEAGFAGALGIQLGGVNYYRGTPRRTPLVGERVKEREPEDITRAIRLMYAVSISGFLSGSVVLWLLRCR